MNEAKRQPKNAAGNVRGRATRSRIRAAAVELFRRFAPEEVTVSQIAKQAGVYPNQITHHFGSKDGLYVDAAFSLLLRDSARLRSLSRRSSSPESFVTGLARTALAVPSTPMVVTALGMGRANAAVHPALAAGMKVLFRQSTHYVEAVLHQKAWHMPKSVEKEVKTFWSMIFGAVLMSQTGFSGVPFDLDVASMVSIDRN